MLSLAVPLSSVQKAQQLPVRALSCAVLCFAVLCRHPSIHCKTAITVFSPTLVQFAGSAASTTTPKKALFISTSASQLRPLAHCHLHHQAYKNCVQFHSMLHTTNATTAVMSSTLPPRAPKIIASVPACEERGWWWWWWRDGWEHRRWLTHRLTHRLAAAHHTDAATPTLHRFNP